MMSQIIIMWCVVRLTVLVTIGDNLYGFNWYILPNMVVVILMYYNV